MFEIISVFAICIFGVGYYLKEENDGEEDDEGRRYQ